MDGVEVELVLGTIDGLALGTFVACKLGLSLGLEEYVVGLLLKL